MRALALLLNYVYATLPASAKVEPEKKPSHKRGGVLCLDNLAFLAILACMGLVLGSLASPASAATMAGGYYHSLAVGANGTVAAWGRNNYGQCTVPATLKEVSDVAAGGEHSLALKADGSVAAWGDIVFGQCNVPTDLLVAGAAVAVAAGEWHSLALKHNGSVAAWGDNMSGQSNVPVDLLAAGAATAVAAGSMHSLALTADGKVRAWG